MLLKIYYIFGEFCLSANCNFFIVPANETPSSPRVLLFPASFAACTASAQKVSCAQTGSLPRQLSFSVGSVRSQVLRLDVVGKLYL